MTAGYPNPAANYVVAIMLPVIGTVLVTARFALRFARKLGLEADDWFCLPALLFVWGCGGAQIWGIKQRTFGYHLPTAITPQNAMPILLKIGTSIEASYIFVMLSYPALGFTKLSILFFYRRIFRGPIFNIVTWIVITIVTAWMFVFTLVWLFSCGNHPRAMWTDFSEMNSRCLNIFDQLVAGAVADWILDIVVLILPCTMVWQLQMPLRQKIYVMGIFLTGIISLIAGILRFVVALAVADFGNSAIAAGNYSSINIANMAGKTLGVSKADWFGMCTVSIFWAMVEVGVALIAINLPALRTGQAIRSSGLYRWLSGWSSSLRLPGSSRSGSSSKKSGDSGGEKKIWSEDSAESTPMQAPWQSLATVARRSDDEETGLRNGIGVAVEMNKQHGGILYKKDYKVTASRARTPIQEREFRERYKALFPPTSTHMVTQPRERI